MCLSKYKHEWAQKSLAPQAHQSQLSTGSLISAKPPITSDPWRMPWKMLRSAVEAPEQKADAYRLKGRQDPTRAGRIGNRITMLI
jgi:hypothetical protein